MNRKKQNLFTGSIKNHFMWLIPLFLFISLVAVSFTPVFQSQADKAGTTEQVKKEKVKKKKLANVTIEREGYFIKNAGTPHAFIALKKKLIGERVPNLSTSKIEGEVSEGGTVRYTITLKNTGNINATDIDVFSELDLRFGTPKNFVFKKCGKRYRNSSKDNEVDISNILVGKGKKCVIQYNVTSTANGTMSSLLYLSPAAEGGEEIGPIEAMPVQVRITPEEQNQPDKGEQENQEFEGEPAEEPIDDQVGDSIMEPIEEEFAEDSEPVIDSEPDEPIEATEELIDEPIIEEGLPDEEIAEEVPEEVVEEPANSESGSEENLDEISFETTEVEESS